MGLVAPTQALRLTTTRLGELPAAVKQPRYERSTLQTGIVHLGLGAFARAHLAVATEAAIESSGDLNWGICGVSLRHADTRDALAPQGGLYTLAVRDADAQGAPRQQLQVLGCVTEVLVAPEDEHAVLQRIAAPHTRIVSLTITEKGYHADAGGAADLITRGLALRRERGLPGLTLVSLDNLSANGRVLRALVLQRAAAATDSSALGEWITSDCSFPCSMVDRIVPRTTDADRAAIAQALGCDDAWPVLAEPFFDWAVEDHFVQGRPAWQHAGVRFVSDAAPYEQLKLRMVNGAHSAIAYLGVLAGWRTADEAMAQPELARFIDALLREEVAPTLSPTAGLDVDAYRHALLRRFSNPALAHRTSQIATDGSQKLPLRWLGTLRERVAAGQCSPRLSLVIAAWLQHLGGVDESGQQITLDDPLREALREQASVAGAAGSEAAEVRHWLAFRPVFGAAPWPPTLADEVAAALRSLRQRGVRPTLQDG